MQLTAAHPYVFALTPKEFYAYSNKSIRELHAIPLGSNVWVNHPFYKQVMPLASSDYLMANLDLWICFFVVLHDRLNI